MSAEVRVLCVDDNEMNRLIVEEALFEDHSLAMAEDGQEALALVDSFRPDVILLDIMMPGIDGYEVCRRLRKRRKYDHLIIIFCSAKAMASERTAGLAAGGNDYITKPFIEDDLRATIARHLERRAAEAAAASESDWNRD